MKKIGIGLLTLLAVLFTLPRQVHTKSMLVEMELVSVSECPLDTLIKPRCLQHTVRSGETLSSIARYYSTEKRKLAVNDLLVLLGNEYLRDRKIPKRFSKALARRGIRQGSDLIFKGDKITVPFTSTEIIERLKEREVSFTIQTADEGAIREISAKLDTVSSQNKVAWIVIVILSTIFFVWLGVLLRRIRKKEKTPVHVSEGETTDIDITDIHRGFNI